MHPRDVTFWGREEALFTCTSGSYTLTAVWYTGPIIKHPFETELKDAGVNTVSGGDQFAWGKVGGTDGAGWWNYCIGNYVGGILAVRQVNNTLTL